MAKHTVESIREIIQQGVYEEPVLSTGIGTPEAEAVFAAAETYAVETDWHDWGNPDAVADAGGSIATYLWDLGGWLGLFDHGSGVTAVIPWAALNDIA